MRKLRALRERFGLPVAWVSNNPYAINEGGPHFTKTRGARFYDMSMCPPLERRFPHVLRAYNEEARRLARALRVPYLGLWHIVFPLFDIVKDGHYTVADTPAGWPTAARALEWALPHYGLLAEGHQLPSVRPQGEFASCPLLDLAPLTNQT